jgi:hypothetical protein
MKRSILTLSALAMVLVALSQNKYVETMQGAVNELYQAQGPADFDPVINKLQRIGQAEKDKWEPHYYTALGFTFKSFRIQESTAKDALLDQGLSALKQASAVAANNAEILALEGFINMLKVSVDPATRGQTLTPKIMATFGQAIAADPANPRPLLFMAQMQIGTAKFFGTPIDEPCKMIQKSVTLFENYRPSSPLTPMWGQEMTKDYLGMCSASDNTNE